jgi:hypothetical protein
LVLSAEYQMIPWFRLNDMNRRKIMQIRRRVFGLQVQRMKHSSVQLFLKLWFREIPFKQRSRRLELECLIESVSEFEYQIVLGVLNFTADIRNDSLHGMVCIISWFTWELHTYSLQKNRPNGRPNALHWSVCVYVADSGKNFFNEIIWANKVQRMETTWDCRSRNCLSEFSTLVMKGYAIAIGIHASSNSWNVQYRFLCHERVLDTKSSISRPWQTQQSKTQKGLPSITFCRSWPPQSDFGWSWWSKIPTIARNFGEESFLIIK